jgi:thiamine transport system ATP-binding protein
VLSVEQLAFSYPSNRERQSDAMLFDIEAQPGEIMSLIGPSGSGKSTLLGLIAGFQLATSGKIRVGADEIQDMEVSDRPVTIVFQEHNLFPHLDVFTNVALGINPSLKLDQDQRLQVDQILNNLGLSHLEKSMPSQLSGGQRQRVAISRALVRRHKVLLLDEPFAALGPALREEMIELLKAIVIAEEMVALLVSHQPSDAMLASNNTAFISNGRVLVCQPTEQLLNQSPLAEVNNYLGKT